MKSSQARTLGSRGKTHLTPSRRQGIDPPPLAPYLGNEQPTHTSASVSARMTAVGQRHTAPEIAVRRIVYLLSARYRVCCRRLPGRPDLSNQTNGWCIFVHWHRHDCKRGQLPKVNLDFWQPKIERCRRRDEEVPKALIADGFRVLTVWPCELAKSWRVRTKLARVLDASRRTIRQQ